MFKGIINKQSVTEDKKTSKMSLKVTLEMGLSNTVTWDINEKLFDIKMQKNTYIDMENFVYWHKMKVLHIFLFLASFCTF